MNWDQIEGKWKEMKGKARTSWGELTDDELDQVGGRKDELVGRIQKRYGLEREEAERQVDDWANKL
ncbi:MAG: CsbD family protein [Halomonas sp.]|nr:CsbD family protein [Halomonas sp.]MCC5883794.1 CsbD family protein [Halomonas sp.]